MHCVFLIESVNGRNPTLIIIHWLLIAVLLQHFCSFLLGFSLQCPQGLWLQIYFYSHLRQLAILNRCTVRACVLAPVRVYVILPSLHTAMDEESHQQHLAQALCLCGIHCDANINGNGGV